MNRKYSINKLMWDTSTFGIDVYQIVIHMELEQSDWKAIEYLLESIDLAYIYNMIECKQNAIYISKNLRLNMVDVNIQFTFSMSKCNLTKMKSNLPDDNVIVEVSKKLHPDVFNLLDFKDSRFIADPRLKNYAYKVYYEWVKNSCNQESKNFIYFLVKNKLVGFLLFSRNESVINIELIGTLESMRGYGIGTKMINELKITAYETDILNINVGTQLANVNAINFYIKNEFTVTKSKLIYHWWKKNDKGEIT